MSIYEMILDLTVRWIAAYGRREEDLYAVAYGDGPATVQFHLNDGHQICKNFEKVNFVFSLQNRVVL